MPDTKPPDPGEIHIRNQRYRPYWEVLQGTLVASMALAVVGLFLADPLDRLLPRFILASYLGLAAVIGFVFVLRSVARRQYGSRPRGKASSGFDWLLQSVTPVRSLKLGDRIVIETGALDFRFPAAMPSRIRFAPDAAEDFADVDRPVPMCQAIVELDAGRQFRLVVTESDAQRLRQWAVANGVAVCDSNGYRPRTVESATGV